MNEKKWHGVTLKRLPIVYLTESKSRDSLWREAAAAAATPTIYRIINLVRVLKMR